MNKTTSTAKSKAGLQSCKKVNGETNIFLIETKMPRHPKLPTPELIVKGNCYAWKCDSHGISIFSESRKNAPLEWLDAYQFEYFYDEWKSKNATAAKAV